ncbi:GNAT family N-acetyltransferase [Piscinibacter sp.]|jgi:RimJ/RimL family protein N-acetyltransferase|uniref:GNAT family N-acetyltransferase n=1 Tax=Piscinibacter sp. TaxID=1903157 RepID=UPI002F419045
MVFTAPPPLHSDRLIVRVVEERDLPALLEIHAVDDVTRFLPYATWQTLADAQAWYERAMRHHADGSALQFVVEATGSGVVVGTCLLFRFDSASARAEIGYVLGQRHWGCGYMREALASLLAFAFNELSLRRIEAEVDPRNAASDRLLRRLGFTHEGLLRQRWVMKGEVKDANVYGLLRHEWSSAPR